jgi:hypothetical protein
MPNSFSPWPEPDRWFAFALRRAVWVSANPFYGEQYTVGPNCPEQFKVRRGWFPFITVNTRLFHFYIGWKPITLADPKFYWRDLVVNDWLNHELFVQLSARWGAGALA